MMALNEIRQQTRRLFLTNKEENLTIDGFPIFLKLPSLWRIYPQDMCACVNELWIKYKEAGLG